MVLFVFSYAKFLYQYHKKYTQCYHFFLYQYIQRTKNQIFKEQRDGADGVWNNTEDIKYWKIREKKRFEKLKQYQDIRVNP